MRGICVGHKLVSRNLQRLPVVIRLPYKIKINRFKEELDFIIKMFVNIS